jgi:flagellar biosynthesis/type III secretory pathway M-ring protein FliF/YscJ
MEANFLEINFQRKNNDKLYSLYYLLIILIILSVIAIKVIKRRIETKQNLNEDC